MKTKKVAKPIDIRYVQGKGASSSVMQSVEFKWSGEFFVEIFTICQLGVVDIILGNTFLNKYGTEIRFRPKVKVVWVA